jgi:hypothetical protein
MYACINVGLMDRQHSRFRQIQVLRCITRRSSIRKHGIQAQSTSSTRFTMGVAGLSAPYLPPSVAMTSVVMIPNELTETRNLDGLRN